MHLTPTISLSAAGQEPRHLDVRGFLAGLVLSSAVGALLYIFLMTA